uniref:NAD(+) kinase n=1 Tax=Macrostomum lignano TaxID=282301 RepID=A0A1I8IH48_9PLAT
MTLHWKPVFQRGLKDSKFDNHRLKWAENLPQRVLVVRKPDPTILTSFIELLLHLVTVFVECSSVSECELCKEEASALSKQFALIASKLKTFVYGEAAFTDKMIDLIVCLGGDGTLLYASSLFKADVPPILAFHLGSLGFLTPHRFENYRQDLQSVLNNRSYFTMRSRLACTLHKAAAAATEKKQDQTVTTMQGDGLIVSSPTGSTAYAMAAGANMIHPSVPALLLAPICPHSLSFRPVILPASTGITVRLAECARSNAWVSFDGRDRQELLPGDHVAITTSEYMVPSISARSPLQDWFSGLAECFHWNVRSLQKALPSSTAANQPATSTAGSGSGSAVAANAADSSSSTASVASADDNLASN